MLDPPYDTNGSGSPVTGMSPRFMPRFSRIWNRNQTTTPTATRRPKESWARRAMRMPRTTTSPSSATTIRAPMKPNSSPATENTKSVCWNGMNPPWVCRPLNRPCPVQPPDPIAIFTCCTW